MQLPLPQLLRKPLAPRWRSLLLAGAGALLLAALLAAAAALAAARIPQRQAALQELIRRETGLDIAFSRLSVRWGWYGPEAVFHDISLAEPAHGAVLVRAAQLSASLDLWRTVRSGQFELGRIVLSGPDIDLQRLSAVSAAVPGSASARPAAEASLPGADLLARWHGGRIDIEHGSLHWRGRDGADTALALRHLQLRRYGTEWVAQALLLPQGAGSSLDLDARMSGDPRRLDLASGTLKVLATQVAFGPGHELLPRPRTGLMSVALPNSGAGDFTLEAAFVRGRLVAAQGGVHLGLLEWAQGGSGLAPLQVAALSGRWQLAPRAHAWRVQWLDASLEMPAAAAGTAGARAQAVSGTLDIARDGQWLRASVGRLPLPVLAALVRWYGPLPDADAITFAGEAHGLSFDWDRERAAGQRLLSAATLTDVAVTDAARQLSLSGLRGTLRGADARLSAELTAPGAVLRTPASQLTDLAVFARLRLESISGATRLQAEDLQLRHEEASLVAQGSLAVAASGAAPSVDAQVALRAVDVALLGALLPPATLAAAGPLASRLSAGQIVAARFSLRGSLDAPLPWRGPHREFAGQASLQAAQFAGSDAWPALENLSGTLQWGGGLLHAHIDSGTVAALQLSGLQADWDPAQGDRLRVRGHLAGEAQQALAWVRARPQLTAQAAGLENIDLRGPTVLDVDFTRRIPAARWRVTALLDGMQLYPLAGLPPVEDLHGALAVRDGRVQRSHASGRWLGGPVSLTVGAQSGRDAGRLTLTARGLLDSRQVLAATGAAPRAHELSGMTQWSAQLHTAPATAVRAARWQLRADSNMAGIGSTLPEPFAKAAGPDLPLHLDAQGGADSATVRVSFGERARALAALVRGAAAWRIERGALQLGPGTPALPSQAALAVSGYLPRLDLPAYLALWRDAGRDAALPALRAQFAVARLHLGTREYPEVAVAAQASGAGGAVRLQSRLLIADLGWSARPADPLRVHLPWFDAPSLADGLAAAQLAGPGSARLSIDELRWQHRPLGAFSATLTSAASGLAGGDWQLASASHGAHGHLNCSQGRCRADFLLEARDSAATLAAWGLRPEVAAARASLGGDLSWTVAAPEPLATLEGSLHMQMTDGALVRVAVPGAGLPPFPLLGVPPLMGALWAAGPGTPPAPLRFSAWSADYTLRQGVASTSDLQFDGEAQIVMTGSVSLATRALDLQATVLRAEQRLPEALRHLAGVPKVTALWLSLRDWMSAGGARPAARLQVRGSWDTPSVAVQE